MADLVIDFCGEQHRVPTGGSLTFGRAADLEVDDNPYMHRVVGRFRNDGGTWWLDNLGSSIELGVVASSGARVHLPAAVGGAVRSAALTEAAAAVEFRAGTTNYRLDVVADAPPAASEPISSGEGTDTVAHGRVVLTADERLLLTALARPRLLDPLAGPTALPSNREVADRFGWKLTAYNRKLDRLCERLRKAGVVGLQGSRGAEATNRRWALVEHAVSSGLVTVADLAD